MDKEYETIGWDAITQESERVYPGQDNPKHYGTLISWRLGGNDPLDGISIYDGGDYWHFVTYGLSELYEKESENLEYSGYGMEMTLKLKKNLKDEEAELKGICGILQAIARVTFENGELFRPYEYLYTGQTQGMDVKMKSLLTGFITIPDPQFQTLETPNGRVEFVEFIGVTDDELQSIINKENDVSYDNKLPSVDELAKILQAEREKGKKIVFTNGCFDIFHVGHSRYLRQASTYGDILVVGVNSDASVKRLKGPERPIISEEERMELLADLQCVSYVVKFEEDTPYELIKKLQPDIITKGGDYKPEEVVGKDIVEDRGGKVVICKLVEGKSTTNIITKIRNAK